MRRGGHDDGSTAEQLAAVRQRRPQPPPRRDRHPLPRRHRPPLRLRRVLGAGPSSSCGRSTTSASSVAPRWPPSRGTTTATSRPTSASRAAGGCCTPSTPGSRPTSSPTSSTHAQDRVILVDPDLLPLVEQLAGRMPSVKTVIVLDDTVPAGVAVDGDLLAYEELLVRERDGVRAARHRRARADGALLHVGHHRPTQGRRVHPPVDASCTPSPSRRPRPSTSDRGDAVLPQVPMFHANAWGVPHAATAVGAKQVFYAGALDAAAWVDLMIDERVTIAAGVPTVWLAVADELTASGRIVPRRPPPRVRRRPTAPVAHRPLPRRVRLRPRSRPGG